MIINHEKPRWPFYLTWIILTSICIPIALMLNFAILAIIIYSAGDIITVNGVRHITEDYLLMVTFIPILGLLTGSVQYALLRRYLPRMGGWILATIGGWFLGILLIVLPGWLNWMDVGVNLDSSLLLMGLAIGTMQWLILRRRLPQAGWWIVANTAGWAVSALITTGNSLNQLAVFTLAIVPACITAAVLALLMKQFKSPQLKTV